MNNKMLFLVVLGALLMAVLAGCAPIGADQVQTAALPVNKAYVDGKEIYFVHLEASDRNAAQQLSDMMHSPVFYVPTLAKVPAEALANVYSFKNGVKGQVSVFDNPPGTEGYSPMRQLNMVIWADESKARELKSVTDIMGAKKAGDLDIKSTGIVVNMPFVVWDGGKR
jgi:hypothetical protein